MQVINNSSKYREGKPIHKKIKEINTSRKSQGNTERESQVKQTEKEIQTEKAKSKADRENQENKGVKKPSKYRFVYWLYHQAS